MAKAAKKATESRDVATHDWIDDSGKVVDDIKLATGVQYTDNASKKTLQVWPQYEGANMKPGHGATFGALVGFKTIATNESSGIRNSKEFDGRPSSDSTDLQLGAIQDRWNGWNAGTFITRTRESVKRDPAKVVEAFADAAVESGKCTEAERATLIKMLTDEHCDNGVWPDSVISTLWTTEGVEAAYRRLMGKPQARNLADTLAALLPKKPEAAE